MYVQIDAYIPYKKEKVKKSYNIHYINSHINSSFPHKETFIGTPFACSYKGNVLSKKVKIVVKQLLFGLIELKDIKFKRPCR